MFDNDLVFIDWRLTDEQKEQLRQKAERNALSVGLTIEQWEAKRLTYRTILVADIMMADDPQREI